MRIRDMLYVLLQKVAPLGEQFTDSKRVAITTANINTMVDGASVTLQKGVWEVQGTFEFGATGSGARNIQMQISDKDDINLGTQRVTIGYGNYAILTTCVTLELDEETTLYVRGSSDKTSDVAGTGIRATRIA